MSIKNVVLVGADGNLGPSMLRGLVDAGFKVTVFKRQSSKSAADYPAGVETVRISDLFPVEELIEPLKGQDAIIVTTAGSQVEVQKRLADAGAQAGVKRFIPADFGSCDSSMAKVQELVPLYGQKTEIRDYLTNIANKNSNFTWTAIVCGHYFDWSADFLHAYPREQRGEILDDGETKFSIATLGQVVKATVAILQKPEHTGNKVLYVQSFNITQNELARSFERATNSKWRWDTVDSLEFEKKTKVLVDSGAKGAVDEMVWYLGVLYSNWLDRETYAMDLLGLQDEDLDEEVRKLVAKELAK